MRCSGLGSSVVPAVVRVPSWAQELHSPQVQPEEKGGLALSVSQPSRRHLLSSSLCRPRPAQPLRPLCAEPSPRGRGVGVRASRPPVQSRQPLGGLRAPRRLLPSVGFGALGLSDTLLLLRPGPRGPAFGALVPSRLGASEHALPLFTNSRAHHEPAGQAVPTATISRDSLGKRSKRGLAPEEIGNWWG